MLQLKCTQEEFKPAEIERVLTGYETYEIVPTDSRKVMGNMNDLLFHYQHHILWEGGFRSCSLDGILHKVNNMP